MMTKIFSKNTLEPFIVIEGIDGTGKSTVSEKLSQKMGISITETPIGFWRKHRKIIRNSPATVRFIYYTLANLNALLFIQKLRKTNMVICTRFIYTTKAYHIVYGCLLARLLPIAILSPVKPSLVYYLTVEEDERLNRINDRKINVPGDYDSAFLEKVHSNYLSFPNLIIIDTTKKTVEEICEIIHADIYSKFSST